MAKRGYARNSADQRRLVQAGLKDREIYREGQGRESFGNWKLRRGDTLLTVHGLRAFGDTRKAMREAVDLVQSWGAEIEDVETGDRTDAKGAQMLDDALARIHGERRIVSPSRAREMQAASVKKRVKGRMPKREALKIWRNADLTIGEAVAAMGPGWSAGTAYRQLGVRGVPTGRRGNKS